MNELFYYFIYIILYFIYYLLTRQKWSCHWTMNIKFELYKQKKKNYYSKNIVFIILIPYVSYDIVIHNILNFIFWCVYMNSFIRNTTACVKNMDFVWTWLLHGGNFSPPPKNIIAYLFPEYLFRQPSCVPGFNGINL